MKIKRKKQVHGTEDSGSSVKTKPTAKPWKILIVDDEEDVHKVTGLSLATMMSHGNRPIQMLSARSGEEGFEVCQEHPDIALALIDVVMENDHAGLDLVRRIRSELKMHMLRIFIRTGQPGLAPAKEVIDNYDIDDYKEKTDLSAQKLYTTVRSGLKSYCDLLSIDKSRRGLEKILNSAPSMYEPGPLNEFFEGVLLQMTGILKLESDSVITSIDSCLVSGKSNTGLKIWAGTGRYQEQPIDQSWLSKAHEFLVSSGESMLHIEGKLVIPLSLKGVIEALVIIDTGPVSNLEDRQLLEIMRVQCESALENLLLYQNLEKANDNLREKNLFIGMAAHDLRNPVGTVYTLMDILPELVPQLSDEAKELMSDVSKNCSGALTMLDDLLDVTKLETGSFQILTENENLSLLVKNVVENFSNQASLKDIEVDSDVGGEIILPMDLPKIMRVMTNLLSNAIKYSPRNTIVKIEVKDLGDQVEVQIRDHGVGIPTDEHKTLFSPFAKASSMPTDGESSTGLGLVICKKIVEAHRGQIWLESEVGKGSTFFFSLPKMRQEADHD